MRASRLEVVIGTLVFRRCSGAISEHRGRFGSRLGLAVLVVAMGCLCSWGSAKAQCIDYGDFLHWVGAVDTPGEAYGVAVSGSHAYVADTKSGLQVADITNPASPRIVGGVDPSGRTFDVAVSGSYAYVVNSSAGLYVLPTQCDPLTGVRGDDRFVSTMVLRVIPNPSSQGTVIRFETPSGGAARVAVYNAEGRFVRGLLDGIVSAGGHELLWDGRNREGGAVAAGVYFVHVSTVEGCRAVRCLRVR